MLVNKVVLSIIGGLFQGLAVGIIINSQIKQKYEFNKCKLFLLMILYSVLSLLIIPNQFRLVYFFSITALTLYFVFKIKDIKVVLYSFNMEVIMSVSEIVIALLLVLIGIDSESIINNNYYNIITNILIASFAVGISYIPVVRKLMKNIEKQVDKNRKFTKNLFIILIIVYLVVLKNGFEFLLKSNYYINILFIMGIVAILTIIMKNELKYEQLEEENKQMLNHVTKYEKIITDQGKANHEFKNQLMVIRGYAQMNSPKLIDYVDSLTQDANKTHSSFLISQLNKFPDGGIKGLLYYKLSIIEEQKLNYQISVEKGVKTSLINLNTDVYKNITKVLGVIFDNAIDASSKSKDKKIIIDVFKEKGFINFNISNTYKGKIDISKVGTGYTSKGSGHGYGLKLVNDIIVKNNYLSIESYLEDSCYVTKLKFKVPRKSNPKQTKNTKK